jgi:hypothetical protein
MKRNLLLATPAEKGKAKVGETNQKKALAELSTDTVLPQRMEYFRPVGSKSVILEGVLTSSSKFRGENILPVHKTLLLDNLNHAF